MNWQFNLHEYGRTQDTEATMYFRSGDSVLHSSQLPSMEDTFLNLSSKGTVYAPYTPES